MKNKILFTFLLSIVISTASGQSTSTELGEKIFLAFKNDSLSNLENYRLKESDLSTFFSNNGLDTNSTQFTVYRSKYTEVTKKLLDRCRLVKQNFPWEKAELTRIELKDQSGKVVPDKNKNITSILEIAGKAVDRPFSMIAEVFTGTDKLWKLGNMISFVEAKVPEEE